MTRHKQEQHQHPRRDEEAPENIKATHSVIIPLSNNLHVEQQIAPDDESRLTDHYIDSQEDPPTPTTSYPSLSFSHLFSPSESDVPDQMHLTDSLLAVPSSSDFLEGQIERYFSTFWNDSLDLDSLFSYQEPQETPNISDLFRLEFEQNIRPSPSYNEQYEN
jgi:hypothetical protein